MRFEDWGIVPYQEAYQRQLSVHSRVSLGTVDDTVVFCRHPHVITCGRRKVEASSIQLPDDFECEVVQTDRGGKWTYHGPQQLMVYVIINLANRGENQRPLRDVAWFVRSLEEMFVRVLKDKYNISAQGCSYQQNVQQQIEKATGVWVHNKKLVSLGVAVKKWTTLHGAALCVGKDQPGFQFLNPCGFEPNVMTSLEEMTDSPVDWNVLQSAIEAQSRISL